MRNLLVPLFMVWCMTLPAKADATITFTIHGATMDVSVERTLSDENAARVVSYAKRAYTTAQVPPALSGEDCQAPDPVGDWTRPAGCDPTTRDTTPQEAITSMISDNFAAIISNVLASEKVAAARAAAAAINPIVPK